MALYSFSLTQLTCFLCMVVPLFDLAVCCTVFAMLLRCKNQEFKIPTNRTWLGTSYLPNGSPPFLFFFHLIFSSVSVIVPDTTLEFWVATFVFPDSGAPCAGTRHHARSTIYCNFLQPSEDVNDAFIPCAHSHFQLMYILRSLGEGALLTYDQDKISATVARNFLYAQH